MPEIPEVDWTPLAGSTKPCPHCDGKGTYRIDHTCSDCNASGREPTRGRVYFFPDSVRVACPVLRADLAPCPPECSNGEAHLHPGPGHHENPCDRCQGRGWIANTNFFKWLDVLNGFSFLTEDMVEALWGDSHPEAAFITELEQAVVAVGGTLYA